jgi:cobalt-precorrin 5A hydrolase
MAMAKTMIVAGIGCKRGAAAHDVEAAIHAALARAGLAAAALDAIATMLGKNDEPGIAAAAKTLGVRIIALEQSAMKAAGARTITRSERVLALTGVPSVAETAALAAAGADARLIAPRLVVGGAACALAASGDAP